MIDISNYDTLIVPFFVVVGIYSGECHDPEGDDLGGSKKEIGKEERDYTSKGQRARRTRCLLKCMKVKGATGCELESKRGYDYCYVHTGSVAQGSGSRRDTDRCWKFASIRV